jgi:sialic acid synthase SpsE
MVHRHHIEWSDGTSLHKELVEEAKRLRAQADLLETQSYTVHDQIDLHETTTPEQITAAIEAKRSLLQQHLGVTP